MKMSWKMKYTVVTGREYKSCCIPPETWNTVKELTRAVKGSSMLHYNTMLWVMRYSVNTPE